MRHADKILRTQMRLFPEQPLAFSFAGCLQMWNVRRRDEPLSSLRAVLIIPFGQGMG
jgi:hypothetical protein